ncbi:hypothetical protein NW768_007076 [Fusarium equiseti]|uniref:Uncharacterized protein n=1 Tax=Fusarium equiseti TaxID=61235 RepID=A0ABQ8RA02_FUSEQ|nr:hypothetical protein NW768_007076 [Fusarium equiseti]
MVKELLGKNTTQRMFPIAFLSSDIPNHFSCVSWAETTLIVLFEAFNPVMLGTQTPVLSNKVVRDIPYWGRTNQQDAWLRANSRPLAHFILDAGRQTKDIDSSLRDFKLKDRYLGLNWAVPLTDATSYETNTWIQTTIPATKNEDGIEEKPMWSFRTTPKRLTERQRVWLFTGRPNTRPTALRLQLPTDGTSLKAGSVVNVVVEIMCNENDKHRYPYVQIPSIGPFDCWTEALRLGIRMEYQDDHGRWQSRYVKNDLHEMLTARMQPSEIAALGDEVKHIEVTWHHAIKIITTLLGWRWQPDNALSRQVWPPFISKRRTMDFDFFNQRLVVGEGPVVEKQLPRLLTLDQTANLIENQFGTGVTIGVLPDSILMQPNYYPSHQLQRQKCDLCYMASWRSDRGEAGGRGRALSSLCLERRVVQTEGGGGLLQCPFSAALGRYCTFTARVEERDDVGDLVYVPREHYPVTSTPCPPNFAQYLEMQENSKEQPVERDGGHDTEKISMAPALRMTRSIKEKLPIFL